MRASPFLLAAPLLVACRPAPVLSERAPPIDAWLVWTADAQGAQTEWIDASGRVFGTADGIVVARGERLYRLESARVPVTTQPCDRGDVDAMGGADPAPAAPAQDGTRTTLSLAAVGGQDVIAVLDEEPVSDSPDDATARYGDYQHDAYLSAALGPYLFVTEATAVDSCGAHGSVGAQARVFDLDQGKPIVLVDPASVGPARERARADLAGRDGNHIYDASPAHIDDVELVASVPTWTDGSVAMRHLFAIGDCYACGDGEWSSYTTTARIDDPTLPFAFAMLPAIPPAVAAWMSSHGEPRGVSWGHAVKAWSVTLPRKK